MRLLIVLFLVSVAPALVNAQVPSGFYLGASGQGVALYQKDYPGGQPDYVVIVDLAKAHVKSVTGEVSNGGAGQGPLGGPNPTVKRKKLSFFWSGLEVSTNFKVFAAVNGQFFSTAADPTPLAFGVKMGGTIFSDGYGTLNEFVGQKRLLTIDAAAGTADIGAFSEAAFETTSAPEAIVGLDVTADKGPNNITGRTFVGVKKGALGTDAVLIFCTKLQTQAGAAAVLSGFGASAQMMLDGGGSSQLTVQGAAKVKSDRQLPHVLAVIAEKVVLPAAVLTLSAGEQSSVVTEGQEVTVDFFLKADASGGPSGPLTASFTIAEPWLEPGDWDVATDSPKLDGSSWIALASDGAAGKGDITLGPLAPGETRRIRLTFTAALYSPGDVPLVTVSLDVAGHNAQLGLVVLGADHWEWDGAGQFEGWTGKAVAGFSNPAGALVVTAAGDSPQLISPALALDSASVGGFELRFKGAAPLKGALWWQSDASTWNEARRVPFVLDSQGAFQTAVLNPQTSGQWTGAITRLRLDFPAGASAFELDWLRAVSSPGPTSGDADGDGVLVGEDCDDNDNGVYPGAPCKSVSGACKAIGEVICAGDTWSCSAELPEPTDEVCDGEDNDCDGETDEDFDVGTACTAGEGTCVVEGFSACDAGGEFFCKGPTPDGIPELCDGADNDCDDAIDEGFGVGEACQQENPQGCTRKGALVCASHGANTECESDAAWDCDGPTTGQTGGETGETGQGSTTQGGSGGGETGSQVFDAGGAADEGCHQGPRSASPTGLWLLALTLLIGVLGRRFQQA